VQTEKNLPDLLRLPVTEEQILSINEADVPKSAKMATKFGGCLLRLTSFDHLTYHVTLCARKSFARRDFPHFLLCAFVAVLLEINQILDTKTIIYLKVGESVGCLLPLR